MLLSNVMKALDRMERTDQSHIRATAHMRLQVVTNTLQALSCVEKAGLVQVRFTLRSRDQQSK